MKVKSNIKVGRHSRHSHDEHHHGHHRRHHLDEDGPNHT